MKKWDDQPRRWEDIPQWERSQIKWAYLIVWGLAGPVIVWALLDILFGS